MNYAGKFDAALSIDGQGFHAPANGHLESFSVAGHGTVPQGAFFVPDPNLLFHGEFKRAGVDLVLSNDGHEFVIHDYFKGEKRAAIASPDGAHLTGDIINALAGNVQYAQAAPGAAAAQVIGHITKLTGSATAVRNGVSIILNNGDNVEKGDVLSTGSDSTLGVTFIDGTVFGLSSNARMVLNEMVYDPNGSSNSSLLSLVAGTITFVAGETAKHGDMKIDTPVATMGIRGTAVLTEISFSVPQGGGDPQPQANFQVLVEPDGTTGSYILFDKVTLLPIATVNQAGQMIQISGGNVSVTNALLSPDVQKLITDVFTLKFTDNNTNTKLTNNSTDTITQDANLVLIKTPNGSTAQATFVTLSNGQSTSSSDKPASDSRVPGAPDARSLDLNGNVKAAFALSELDGKTGVTTLDAVSGKITFFDFNLGDRPTVKVDFASFTYQNADHTDVTAGLSDLQKADIAATEAKITVVAASDNSNTGSATWTYSVPDGAFDFLAAGETLTLTYKVRVDNNFAADNETAFIDITITVTGTNDTPVITSSVPTITFEGGTSVPGGPLTSKVPTSGTLTFTDVDLTDTHKVSVKLTGATLPDGSTVPPGPLAIFEKAMSVAIDTDSTGTGEGVIDWSLADLPVYLADFIPKGEVLTLTYTVTVTDSQGATATQTITVTIKGTDSPAVVWVATSEAGSSPGGFWKDAANWETGTVPTINDDVIVITDQLHGLTPSYPVTIDEAAFAKSLTMNDFDTSAGHRAPEVINQSTLTIAQTLNLSADSILTNSVGATISVGGKAEILDTSVLTNSGTLTLAGGGDFAVGASITNAGTIELTGGTLTTVAEIHNAGGKFKVHAGATLDVKGGTIESGKLIIRGALVLEGTSVLAHGKLDNSGAVTITGTVAFDKETVDNDSTIEIQAGATLTLDRGTKVANSSGTITVDDNGVLVLNQAEITGGTLMLSGTLVSTGISAINSADITNTGTIDVTGGTLTIDPVVLHTITNQNLIEVNGAELDISGDLIVNTGTLEAIKGGTLKFDAVKVTNTGGTVTVDGTSKLYLSGVEINGGSLDNAGHLYGVTGSNTVTAAVTNTGTIEVQSGTLHLAGGLSGVGTLIIDDGATLELAGATAQTVTFAGGADTLQLDNVAGESFTGTIAGQSTAGGTFTVTGAGNITTASGDALDFTASGGTIDAHADIVLTPTGALTGAAGGIFVTQNGVGDISLTATKDITGQNGNGIWLRDSASGSGDIIVTDLTGKASGTGAGSVGLLVENLNPANDGDITIKQLGGAAGGAYGIDATTKGDGDISIEAGGNVTGDTVYGTAIGAFDHGGGDVRVTNEGDATGAVGLSALATGAGNITIVNDGDLTGTGTVGIIVTQNGDGATGSTQITNTGSVVGADGHAAIFVQENAAGTALIDNSGTIGPDDSGTVTSTTFAIVETGGAITIDNTGDINGNISVASATFNNEAGGTWTVSGSSFFGTLSTFGNAGEIDLHDGASIFGADGAAFAITNSGEIESWGSTSITGAITNTGSIEVDSGTLTLFGSLSGSGSVTIDAGATLTLEGTVSQTITFSGDAAELKIDTTSFGGSIAGLTATDKLDLSTITFDGGTTATYDAETGNLVVSDAYGHSITVKLVGDYSNAHFAGSDDGTGHTLITLNATDDAPSFKAAETSQSASFSELADTTGAPSTTTDPAPAATGTVHFTDVDLTDRPQASITDQTVTWLDTDQTTHLTLTADEVTALEQALTLQQAGNHNNGAIGWTYSIPDSTLDFLGEGQTATVVSTITLDDQHGGTDTAQVTVTISGKNDAPTLDAATLASVGGGDTDPAGAATSDLFAGKFHDVDQGASLKAIAITADNATESQGTWQYEVAGTDQWVDITGVSDSNALVLSPDTLIRFVPADGYSGSPGTLDVHALDDTYAGDITGATPVSIDITATGIGHGGSSPASDLAASISTEATAPSNSNVDVWTGSVDQNWDNDGNWSLGHAPTATEVASVDTDSTVYLDLGNHGTTIGGLTLSSVTELDITGTAFTPESEGFGYLLLNGKLTNDGSIDVQGVALYEAHDVTNAGILEADGPHGLLWFGLGQGNTIDNGGGKIEAANGAEVDFTSSTVNGGEIDALGEGSLVFLSQAILNGTSLKSEGTSYFEVGATTTFNGTDHAMAIDAQIAINDYGKLVLDGFVNDSGDVNNAGTIVVETGLTSILGDLTGSGIVKILGASLELGGTSDSAIQFVGSGVGTLHLDSTSHFTGTVTGFSYGDNIDLSGIDPKNVSLVSTEDGLQVHYGSGDGDYFTITGNYDASGFSTSSDGNGGTDLVWSHQSPVIDTTHFTHVHDEATNTDTVTGLSVSGSSTETYTVTAETEGAKEGSSVTPSSIDGVSLDQVNTALHSVTYDPGATPPDTDMITFKVTDSLGVSDTVNFIFDEGGSGPVTLTGTSGKDVIFATESSDTLISVGGQDQFVFGPASTTDAVQHTVYGFDTTQDKIDLRQFDTINSVADLTITQQNTDTLITLDDHETILLKNVAAGNLHASDFIVTNHGTT
ncbi:FecR domain-containing protein [Bradyrhizobium sp. UFLA05-109]